jgi:hypothetical protein
MGGLLLFLVALSGLITASEAKVSSEVLDFLVENGPILVATSIRAERVSLSYNLNLDETTRATVFAKIKIIDDTWEKMSWMDNADLKEEFTGKLHMGKNDFATSGANLKHLASYLTNEIVSNKSTCVFEGSVLQKDDFESASAILEKNFDRIKTLTAASFATNPDQYTLVYGFIESFNSIANAWCDLTNTMVTEIDTLRGSAFPESLKGHLETLQCLNSAKDEVATVKYCNSGLNNVVCELEYRYPNKSVSYTKMATVNYEGVELKGKSENFIYAKDPQTQKLVLLNCSQTEIVSKNVPLCEKVTTMDACLSQLLHHDIDGSIKNCKFTFAEPKISERLNDESILISRAGSQVSENGRLIFRPAPIQIYSNYEVVVSNGEDEILYQPTVSFDKQQTLTTKLTAKQIQSVIEKANWDEYLDNMQLSDYLEYVAIGLQIVFIPLALCGACLGCKNRNIRKIDRRVLKEHKKDLKRRHSENQALLSMQKLRPVPTLRNSYL